MTLAFAGDVVPLDLVLGDYGVGFYPQARIYNGTTHIITVDLALVSAGYYYATWSTPTPGQYAVIYDIFIDPGHTTYSDRYDAASEDLTIFPGTLAEEKQGGLRQAYTLDTTSNSIIVNTWLEIGGTQPTAGLSNATLHLYKSDGTLLSTPPTQASPISNGVFRFIITPIPSFFVGENATFSVATIDYNGPPSRTLRGVVGVTFSRSS